MNEVIHFELPADDRDRAVAFYTGVFGWAVEELPFEDDVYLTVTTTTADDGAGGIDGAIIEREGPLTAPVVTVGVASIDDHAAAVEAAGGSVVVPKGEVPETGYYAYVEDTEGNVIGLWESIEPA